MLSLQAPRAPARDGSLALVLALCLGAAFTLRAIAQSTDTLLIRGRPQIVRVFGLRGSGDPIVVSSGDGGWVHLAPHVADVLAGKGFFVVGFDARAYLASFTSRSTTLRPEDEPGDYRVLAEYAAQGSTRKPVLIGVSEGAGLSVLAATDPRTREVVAGVIGLGLPDLNELGWRWKDTMIYVTHGLPREPIFSAAAVVDKVSPLPLAAIHSTHDEFVPVTIVQKVFQSARDPKKLWVVNSSDHRFSDNLKEFDARLLEAVEWIKQHQPK